MHFDIWTKKMACCRNAWAEDGNAGIAKTAYNTGNGFHLPQSTISFLSSRLFRWFGCPRPNWTHLDCTPRGDRTAGCPFQRCIQIGNVNDDKAAKQFLRFGIRAVLDLALTVAHADRGGGLGRLQSRASDKDASLSERVGI